MKWQRTVAMPTALSAALLLLIKMCTRCHQEMDPLAKNRPKYQLMQYVDGLDAVNPRSTLLCLHCLAYNWQHTKTWKTCRQCVRRKYTICCEMRRSSLCSTSRIDGWWTHRLGPKVRHFADDIIRCIFCMKTFNILIKISLKIVPNDPIDNNAMFR